MEVFYETKNGRILHGDNIECLDNIEDISVDSCISDFPYAIEFMGKNWDSAKCWNQGVGRHGEFPGTGYSGKKRPAFYANTHDDKIIFYNWCYDRAKALFRVMKPGAYVAIFGHPKTNHRMKCALEDAGFIIVEEIDWIYLTGFPKNQDIGKLFYKVGNKALAEQYDGYKTAGLKPAHEPITIFQKPLNGTYIQNIEKYGCGAMNIDACRVPISQEDIDTINAKASKNPTSNYSEKDSKVYGRYAEDRAVSANTNGRFPPNVILDDSAAGFFDEVWYNPFESGNWSRMFPIMKYCNKISPSERELSDGSRNPHVTVKPVELIEWLIKLLTPKGGFTIDITAGSCTHAVACEKLNYEQNYDLKWVDIELMNTESEPYCNVGKQRVEAVNSGKAKKLF